MSESKNSKFLGTYFNPDMILRLVRWTDILAWVVVAMLVSRLAVVYGLIPLVGRLPNAPPGRL